MFFDELVKRLLLVLLITAEQSGEERLLLALFVKILIEQSLDGHHFLIEHIHLLFEGLQINLAIPLGDFPEGVVQHLEVLLQNPVLLPIERFMLINEVLGILDPFFQLGYQFLRGAVVIKILNSEDEVGMLSKMGCIFGLAFLAYLPTTTRLHRTDERIGLLMLAAQLLLAHFKKDKYKL